MSEPLVRLSRRALLARAAVLGTAGLAVAACIPSIQPATPTATPSASQTHPGTPTNSGIRTGGTLRIGRLEDISLTGIPHLLAPSNFQISNLIYDTLVVYDDQLVPQPRLATSWAWSPDYRQLSLRLRPGVKFHTGRPFTSEDARFNLERLRDPSVGSQFRAYAQAMEVLAPSPDRLVIRYQTPVRSSFDAITLTFMADPETIDQSQNGRNFVGTGPFVFDQWVPGDHLRVRRNADYWQPGKPSIDGAELRVYGDQQQAFTALQTGFIDWMVGVAATNARQLQSDAGYQVLQNGKGSTYFYLGLDVTSPLLGDKRVRQALGYALNRPRIAETALSGFARPASTPWPETSPAYDASLDRTYAYELTRARQLLNDAGWTPGATLPIFVSEAAPATGQMAQILQADLSSIGLPSTIQTLSQPEFVSRITRGQFGGAWITSLAWMNFSPATFFNVAFPVKVPNSSNFISPRYTALIDQLSRLTDDQQLRQTTDELTHILLDEAFVLMICDSTLVQSGAEVARSYVKQIVSDRFRLINYQDLWLDR